MTQGSKKREEEDYEGRGGLREGVVGGKFPAALADRTQVKSGQEEEEPDPQDQAMPGQSLGIIQANDRRRNQTLKIRPCQASLRALSRQCQELIPGREGCRQGAGSSQDIGDCCWFLNKKGLLLGFGSWFSGHQERACWRLYLLLWLTGLKCQQIQWTNLLR